MFFNGLQNLTVMNKYLSSSATMYFYRLGALSSALSANLVKKRDTQIAQISLVRKVSKLKEVKRTLLPFETSQPHAGSQIDFNSPSFKHQHKAIQHPWFFNIRRRVRTSIAAITHRQILGFSNFLIYIDLTEFNAAEFFFTGSTNLTIGFNQIYKPGDMRISSRKLPIKLASQSDHYKFLENNEPKTNKILSYIFFNLYFDHFVDTVKTTVRLRSSQRPREIKALKLILFGTPFKSPLKHAISEPIRLNSPFKKYLKCAFTTFNFFKSCGPLERMFILKSPRIAAPVERPRVKANAGFKIRVVNLITVKEKQHLSEPFLQFLNKPSSILVSTNIFDLGEAYTHSAVVYSSRWSAYFLSHNLGFFFTTTTLFNAPNCGQKLANFKKELFSFNIKSDLEKKILKTYFFNNNIEFYSNNVEKSATHAFSTNTLGETLFKDYSFVNFFLPQL